MLGGHGQEVGDRPRSGVQPAEAALPREELDAGHELASEKFDVESDVDLAVVGGHHQHRARWEAFDQVGHQPVTNPELGVVSVSEAAAVGDLVDAVVVGVDEGLTGTGQSVDLHRERREHLVAVERGVPEMDGGEAGPTELVL